MSSASNVNISLEQHLIETLEPLVPILPHDLSGKLSDVLEAASKSPSSAAAVPPPPLSPHSTAYTEPLINYSLLSAISTWTRSAEGRKALAAHDPPLDPASYAMVALLAGTRTSPEKRFPDAPLASHAATSHRELNDRRAVTAVLNALLSIFGAGVATWWAADRLGWRDEWKALLALAVAIVVATSEAILYLIWASRRSTSPAKISSRNRIAGGRVLPSSESNISSKSSEDDAEGSGSPQLSGNVLPPASPAMQEHRTLEGLRERKQGSPRGGRLH